MIKAGVEKSGEKEVQALDCGVECEAMTVKALEGNTGGVAVGPAVVVEEGKGTILAPGDSALLAVGVGVENRFLPEYAEDGIIWGAVGV